MSDRPLGQRDEPTGDRPRHPPFATAMLLLGVTLLIVVLAALSTFR
ncbi:MAG: hypothetical protein R2698_04710 [Microthrixaceae bacterium]